MTTQTLEQDLAKAVKAMQDAADNAGVVRQELGTIRDQLKIVADENTARKADDAKVKSALDELRDQQKAIQDAIANSKRGLFVPGMADERKQFSFIRATRAIQTRNWEKAGFEKSVFDEVRKVATIATDTDTDGGFWVPDQMIPEVIESWYTQSALVNLTGEDGAQTLVTVYDGLTGGTVKLPKYNGGMIAYWIGEKGQYTTSKPDLGEVNMTPHKLGVMARITLEMQRMANPRFEAALRRDASRALAKALDYAGLFGPGGGNSPKGLTGQATMSVYRAENGTVYPTIADAVAATNWAGAAFNPDHLDNMLLALEEDLMPEGTNTARIFAPRTERWLRQLKVDNYSGQAGVNAAYLFGMPMLSAAKLQEAIGRYVKSVQIPTTQLPGASIGAPAAGGATAKHTTVFVGDWAEYLLGRWGGIEIETDGGGGDGFPYDWTQMKLRTRCDWQLRQDRAFILCPDAKVRA